MSRSFYNGYIFQNSDGKYLVVIEIKKDKYWSFDAVYQPLGQYYADRGIGIFPSNVYNITASFDIGGRSLFQLLKARHSVKRALGQMRQDAGERLMHRRDLEDKINLDFDQEAGHGLPNFEQSRFAFDYQCDIAFGQLIMSMIQR